ncbi:MAG: HsdM family class I SAM-dependent methyltransferase [Aureispira sp.]
MTGQEAIEFIGLDRAISIQTNSDDINSNDYNLISAIKKLGVDSVYMNTDDNNNVYPSVFLKKVALFDEETLQDIRKIHRNAWNYKKVIFLYAYSEVEIRIYNCFEKPVVWSKADHHTDLLETIEISRCSFSDLDELENLKEVFSRVALDTGAIWKLPEAVEIREKIRTQSRVDKYLLSSLINTTKDLQREGLDLNFIHKIILRSLFLLYLEDRGATDEKFYSLIREGATSYFDILDDIVATKKLYNKLDNHFNGNVFIVGNEESISIEQLKIVKKCFISGNNGTSQLQLFDDWRLFDFSIIQIELLSEIYEAFLLEIDPDFKRNTGAYYTPPALVEFILNEKLSTSSNERQYNTKVLDPSCGSGIFLVESFKRLVKRYENCHGHKLTDFNTLKKILTDNIFGVELHKSAIEVAAFSLYLALLDFLDPKTIWQNEENHLPYLIYNPDDIFIKEQGKNLICADTISENELIEAIKVDLVVGNPPFGTKNLLPSIKNYCEEYNFAKEAVLPFLHKATTFAPEGEIALIFNTKVLTNLSSTYKNFRRWLFNDCYVESVFNFSILRKAKNNYGGQLFGNAVGPVSIVYYQKNNPQNPLNKIPYYAPNTYIKSGVIEGLVIDETDLKFLPREECQKPDTKIWKVAMWGNMNDWNLIESIKNKFTKFKDYLQQNDIRYNGGLNGEERNQQRITGNFIETSGIERYYTSEERTTMINRLYRRHNNMRIFNKPLAVIKQGISDKNIRASFFDYDVYYKDTVYGFSTENVEKLKSIVCIFNSNLAKYFLFLVSSTWGIERDKIQLQEYLDFPYCELNVDSISIDNFRKLGEIHNLFQDFNSAPIIEWIDKEVYNIYEISKLDTININDTIKYSIDLFHKQDTSIALYPINEEMLQDYACIISDEINDFLSESTIFANATVYDIVRSNPLMMIKISFNNKKKTVCVSHEIVSNKLKEIDMFLWEQQGQNIFFRKSLNYKKENDIYIIRPNQARFWSKSMAISEGHKLILEILNGK